MSQQSQHFPKEQTDLLQAVYEMRQAQQKYFEGPNKFRLQVAKAREQKVDVMLMPYIKAGAIKVLVKASQQPEQKELFS